MTLLPLPTTIDDIDPRRWETFEPYFAELQQRPLTDANTRQWLADWSKLNALLWEAEAMIRIEKSLDTADEEKEQIFLDFVNEVTPKAQVADQLLKKRALSLDIHDEDMVVPLRHMRNEADLFCEENIPLLMELTKLDNEYDKITGGLTAIWDGEEKNLSQLKLFLNDKDRSTRERAWRTMMDLWLGQRAELNKLYADMLQLRRKVGEQAGLPDYRAYAFREKGRFDYTPEDCFTFHKAIEEVIVPAVQRIYGRKRQRLDLDMLRPWDLDVDASVAPPLKPYQGQDELIQGSLNMLNQVDLELGRHFAVMAEDELLDLDTRTGKALGGYCSTLYVRKRPFIFMNGVGIHDDVQTILHEAGHAFHVFESTAQPLVWQVDSPMEFCEVASMSMELLAAPYLTKEHGGFYTPSEAARARIEHLEGIILFLPYMAVVDAFQHWVYTNPEAAMESANCDAEWNALWDRFMPGVDWSGFEDALAAGWHRKPHIFGVPFYYIEYGMAQVGALQVWRNSLTDQAGTVAAYRLALSLGGTKTLPELFAATGAEFRFDTEMLTALIVLVEQTIEELGKAI
ncbi:MAG: M3 family oligoendopeptidase [Chloroflexi bacterium]|nr:M3 family oligoendopeptidase [Chloroflexota bacterium]